MNILITGAKGQLGSEMQVLAQNYSFHTCIFTDVDELDITKELDVNNFFKENKIECVVNCAAYTAVDMAEYNIEKCDLLNHWAPGNLARAASACGASFIQISTDYVFNGRNSVPYTEKDEPCPNSMYGRTKYEGERLVRVECPGAMIIRTAWLYSSFGKNFVKSMITKGAELREMGVVFDQIGTPTYARDLAAAIFTIITRGVVAGVYNFSNEGVCSWYDFAKTIHRLAGITTCHIKPLHTNEYPAVAQRPAYSVLDKTKIKSIYQLEIPYWYDSLVSCVKLLSK